MVQKFFTCVSQKHMCGENSLVDVEEKKETLIS